MSLLYFRMNFKQLLCAHYALKEEEFIPFVLKKVLYKRTRLLAPVSSFFYPNFLFHEIRLIEKAGKSENLDMIQFQVDFYHHKFVTQSVWKEVLNVRASGQKLVALAREVYKAKAEHDTVENKISA